MYFFWVFFDAKLYFIDFSSIEWIKYTKNKCVQNCMPLQTKTKKKYSLITILLPGVGSWRDDKVWYRKGGRGLKITKKWKMLYLHNPLNYIECTKIFLVTNFFLIRFLINRFNHYSLTVFAIYYSFNIVQLILRLYIPLWIKN